MTSTVTATTVAGAPEQGASPRRVVGLVVALTVVLGTLLLAFALPSIHAAPHGVPLGLAGPAELVGRLEPGLTADGAFDVTVTATADEARDLVLRRQVDGAIAVGAESVTVLYATAASPSVAQLVQATGARLADELGLAPIAEDVRPFAADDPRGVGLAAGALPLTLGGWLGAVAILFAIRRPAQQLVAVAAFSVLGGVTLTSLLFAVGTFEDRFVPACAAGVLGIAATAFGIVGLRAALGKAGIALAIVALIFLGNPLSGLSSSPEMLPTPWGAIGQALPPGATGMLLRNVVFFEGHATAGPIVVLSAWLVGGLALYGLSVWRTRGRGAVPAAPPSEAA